MILPVSWSVTLQPLSGLAWRVYAGVDEEDKGTLVAEVPIEARTCNVDLPEGEYVLRVVQLSRDGRESAWRNAETRRHVVTGRGFPPPALESVAVGQIDPLTVRVLTEPATLSDAFHEIEVVELPAGVSTPELGIVVGRYPAPVGGPLAPRMMRQASPPIAVEGAGGSVPTTRRLAVRGTSPYGDVGTATIRDVAAPERVRHFRVEIGSVLGNTINLISSPAATDPWELDATDGIRLRATPTVADLDADWGTAAEWGAGGTTVAGGLQRFVGYYCDSAIVTTLEKDLGAECDFVLEAYVLAGRKTAAGAMATQPVSAWNTELVNPVVPEVRGRSRLEELTGPAGRMRHTRVDGSPTEPLRMHEHVRVQYVVDTSAIGTPLEADWIDYVPGLVLHGRYVMARVKLLEPTGLHQLIVPKLVLSARIERTHDDGASSPVGAVSAAPGSTRIATGTNRVYGKSGSALGTDGWKQVSDWRAPKEPVYVATAAALPANTRSGNVLTASANGTLTVDGVSPVPTGARVLVQDEATAAHNGIYVVTNPGAGGAAWVLTRAEDFDEDADVRAGILVVVCLGTANEGKAFRLEDTGGTIVVNTTSLSFVEFGGGGSSTGRLVARTVYTSGSGNHTWNAATTQAVVTAYGGGGGGGGADMTGGGGSGVGGGGAAGAKAVKHFTGLTGGGTAAYAVGGGGNGGGAGNNAGTAGTDTTFSTLTAKGGSGGASVASGSTFALVAGGAGVVATGGDVNGVGATGGHGVRFSALNIFSGEGASSDLGAGGAAVSGTAAGSNATGIASGGGGAAALQSGSDQAGGNGSAGVIVVEEYA